MENLERTNQKYFDILKERFKESRVYKPHQLIGLKLAKTYDNDELLRLAKNLAERKDIDNKGAYFMKLLNNLKKL